MALVRSIFELEVFAKEVTAALAPRGHTAVVMALYGDLGAGKSAFVKALAKALGVSGIVTSPTFVLQKIYPLQNQKFERLIHIDAYRLESPKELRQLRFEKTAKDPKNLIVVEWADRVKESLPRDAVKIHFAFVDETTREITIEV
ncbi:tRNA (adenosine(37)-N6)-threonylcarbamoyltransferase complex ATPase subunit type 1 TsaE [Candidatus Kaiserbacteria bacterium RIFCSPHIGHO2_02_FULL_50_9]|uniref:tRNA threonylcarbamoyladenosine biosynthesis protein TsaE n=1 Tax=Candidatus Kaiserbacteria bacterium RIFCSPLOWO2_01_FULL_51_21 TaxID=1798508 RepID=A0A1F6ED90_9BACT|nr:MAG: tRNA (adenosine(37)-N6)-threonylcarbamoyltransferase complex ATPase subunit type 1 TsaE [Candidatus Kaiserbacteria bacterium RIFCSPHIGHO2_01_FULL_51_33]OGG63753.1 MAG: tRNA (adenosine(37)-N6)-threonylcarbamoyltransferase complex ATPase subunit type 1 TsaE [Candidatus Kaiserbacteria bacterium RIFCSPHIGHO2_02_FULL_50_9]OGG71645.1 MAG: tRNA (adenosine(37)-N6)-threonylcarbamoyltransferase complex ATPase subunit type 1 TsaE [Candidatus Kaiserbacteria bacterium RIFCSPLOWO2_01_FULL_51_21]